VGDANAGKIIMLQEDNELSYFWDYIGGKLSYANADYLKYHPKFPRLFVCSNTTGSFKVDEIHNFTQEDLDNDDVFIMDCHAEVFLWAGVGANEQEKKNGHANSTRLCGQGSNH